MSIGKRSNRTYDIFRTRPTKRTVGPPSRSKLKSFPTAEPNISPSRLAAMPKQFDMEVATSKRFRKTKQNDESKKMGAGRTNASRPLPGILDAIRKGIDTETAGSPVTPGELWTNRSCRELSKIIQELGFVISPNTIDRLLREELGLGRRQALKDVAIGSEPDRDAQFQRTTELRRHYHMCDWPIISIDTKRRKCLAISIIRASAEPVGASILSIITFQLPAMVNDPLRRIQRQGERSLGDTRAWIGHGRTGGGDSHVVEPEWKLPLRWSQANLDICRKRRHQWLPRAAIP